MPKTTTTDRDTTEASGTNSVPDFEAEVDEVVAGWDRAETERKRARARDVVTRRRFEQGRFDRVADIAYWEKRLARFGCRPVIAAWPTIPLPRQSSGAYAPNERMTALERPRPVVYNTQLYRLDEKGIHLRPADWWIASPIFQVARGRNEAHPDMYAVEVNGEWLTVQVDPRNPNAVRPALTGAGLRLNPEPVHVDVNLNRANLAGRNSGDRDHITFTAWDRLAAFLDDHHRELPIR